MLAWRPTKKIMERIKNSNAHTVIMPPMSRAPLLGISRINTDLSTTTRILLKLAWTNQITNLKYAIFSLRYHKKNWVGTYHLTKKAGDMAESLENNNGEWIPMDTTVNDFRVEQHNTVDKTKVFCFNCQTLFWIVQLNILNIECFSWRCFGAGKPQWKWLFRSFFSFSTRYLSPFIRAKSL